MQTSSSVFIRHQVIGFHAWPEAPDQVAFLRNRHRHVFYIEVGFAVTHDDRDLEFFILKRQLIDRLKVKFARNDRQEFEFDSLSCESIARRILLDLDADWCSVSEDDENGALVQRAVPKEALIGV